jgi:hypothetical protein
MFRASGFLSESDQTFLLLLIIVCLGACLVWAFWEIENARERRRQQSTILSEARRMIRPNRSK